MVTRGRGAPARAVPCGEAGLRRRCPVPFPRGASRLCLLALIAAREVSVLERGEKARALGCGIMQRDSYGGSMIATGCPGQRCRSL